MALLPPDHDHRRSLAHEVHARPPETLDTPARATYVAVLVDTDARGREFDHLAALCRHFGAEPPTPGASHLSLRLAGGPATGAPELRLKWERHGEFSGYTFFAQGPGRPGGSDAPVRQLPADWLAALPGRTVFAAHGLLLPLQDVERQQAVLDEAFGAEFYVGSEVGDGAGVAYTDFRIHADGFARIVVFDRHMTPRQAGRTLQRLFEIEVYRMMSLLALPIARQLSPRIVEIERALAALTDQISHGGGEDEALLNELTRLAAEVERALAGSQFRFGACRAYAELVHTRIGELRERRIPGLQTVEEFMARRFRPAVSTVGSVSQRLQVLSERVAQASALLSTRVDIARERQNQALLASMDRRARLQLRLQQTVEGLSVAAIAYYLSGLIGYVAKGLKASGLHVDPDLIVGIALPVVIVGLLIGLRRARRHLRHADADEPAGLA